MRGGGKKENEKVNNNSKLKIKKIAFACISWEGCLHKKVYYFGQL